MIILRLLCAMCSLSWAKIRKKNRHSVCLRAFFYLRYIIAPCFFQKIL